MANTHNRSLELEVTVISGEDLRINDRPIKNNAFVTVKADSGGSLSSLQDSTKPDVQSESYPYWDEKLHVDLPAGSRYVVVEVCRRSSAAVDKLVGTAWIPVSDFVGDYTPENYLHFLSYRLRDAQGQRNGIVNISVRVITSSYKGTAASSSSSSSPSVPKFGIPVDREKTGGTVTGMPVWYPNQWKS
ncbi:BON1-associated protein 1-like [Rhodamnia argentea]|uniref:BON1-associated protein 1-like n=1 Tax=Rhodamnia argentea TaxID=178133 RepID=A0A8B8PFM4_9MYRT|nr:BON1-associated protein 1-like [Rhodamnia argentea]